MKARNNFLQVMLIGVFSWLALADSAAASLLNSNINADITLTGSDDNGSYTVNVFNGAINVGGGVNNTYNFFRQNTNMGYHTASNQLTGSIGLTITDNTITLVFDGQAQPVELQGIFTNIPPAILSDVETSSGFISGVAMPLANSFTSDSVTISAFYLGFQPGTHTSQTDTLTFGEPEHSPVPEPVTMLLFGTGLAGLVAVRKRK